MRSIAERNSHNNRKFPTDGEQVGYIRQNAGLLAGYDDSHVERLTLAILQAIVTTSTTGDVTVLRGPETRDALARALALVALEPAAKTRRLVEDHAHMTRRLVAHHRRNPKLAQFHARMTRVDLSCGGRA